MDSSTKKSEKQEIIFAYLFLFLYFSFSPYFAPSSLCLTLPLRLMTCREENFEAATVNKIQEMIMRVGNDTVKLCS